MQEQSVLEQFSFVFESLGKLEREYTIKLQDKRKVVCCNCALTNSHSITGTS